MLNQKYDICIVGAGITGALIAAHAAKAGKKVLLIEAGKQFNFSNRLNQLKEHLYLNRPQWPWEHGDRDTYEDSSIESIGRSYDLNRARVKAVGGSTLHWGGKAQRLFNSDFNMFSLYGYGADWPISYEELEPFYGLAEAEIGVSGSVNVSDPYRSSPYPMKGFPHSHDDKGWYNTADKLGIDLDTVSQAINSVKYKNRSQCLTYSACNLCPSGARYSADIHVAEAIDSGNCTLVTETVARRIRMKDNGDVDHILVTNNNSGKDHRIIAKNYIIAAHAIESARLLLLSQIGNESGQLGRNLMEHWYASVVGLSNQPTFPNRIGFATMECSNYYDGEERFKRGAIKIEFSNSSNPLYNGWWKKLYGDELKSYMCSVANKTIEVAAEVEHAPNPLSRVTLSQSKVDMFGDPSPHINFHLSDFDKQTHERAYQLIETLMEARGLTKITRTSNFVSASHHMGTCRMSDDPSLGVVNKNCKLHGSNNLYVCGSSVFASGGARQPTLTIAALSIRLAQMLINNR